jgi:hypothetical protein
MGTEEKDSGSMHLGAGECHPINRAMHKTRTWSLLIPSWISRWLKVIVFAHIAPEILSSHNLPFKGMPFIFKKLAVGCGVFRNAAAVGVTGDPNQGHRCPYTNCSRIEGHLIMGMDECEGRVCDVEAGLQGGTTLPFPRRLVELGTYPGAALAQCP